MMNRKGEQQLSYDFERHHLQSDYKFYHNTKDSFEKAIEFPILLGQYLGLTLLSSEGLNLYSVRVLAAVIVALCQLNTMVLSFMWQSKTGTCVRKDTIVFFGGAGTTLLLLIRLSVIWPKLISHWQDIEFRFGHQRYLRRKFIFISILIIIPSAAEDLISLSVSVLTSPLSLNEVLAEYSYTRLPQVFNVFSYAPHRAICALIVNSMSSFIYSFSDQIIIMTSIALGDYFKMFNDYVMRNQNNYVSDRKWRNLRNDYNRLCNFTGVVNDSLCHLLCLTFVVHLYVICTEIHQGTMCILEGKEKTHFIISFLFSISRACALCITTVRIYEESKAVLKFLYCLPSFSYSGEVEIFIIQVQNSEAFLTGSYIFSMKRKFILTIVGTIISSQILLLQMKEFFYTTPTTNEH